MQRHPLDKGMRPYGMKGAIKRSASSLIDPGSWMRMVGVRRGVLIITTLHPHPQYLNAMQAINVRTHKVLRSVRYALPKETGRQAASLVSRLTSFASPLSARLSHREFGR